MTVPKFPACDNRDEGKTLLITEWPAARADTWMMRLAFTFNKGGGEIPMDLRSLGWEGLAVIGINTFLRGNIDPDIMVGIADELLDCVKIVRDPKHPHVVSDLQPSGDDIEEVATRWWLRDQVVSVHTNFSFLDAICRLASSIMAAPAETTVS